MSKYPDPNLDFDELRYANLARQNEWPGAEGVDLAFRGLEMAGEMGELANKMKKLVRLNRGISGTTEERAALMAEIEDEMGDCIVTLDLICMEIGVDLGRSTRRKFNKTSAKHGLSTRLG